MSGPTTTLLERDSELTAIASSLRAAASAEAGPLVIVGEAGAGKTALLDEAIRGAEESGFEVLRARGGEYERDFPYGVVRQLFEPVLDRGAAGLGLTGSAAMAAPAFEGVGAEDPFSIQHGLYWLVTELADSRPLLIAVDDAQWADAASLQALTYIGRRLDGMRAGLALTVRTGDCEGWTKAVDELRGQPDAQVVRPTPLSVSAVAALADEAGRETTEEFAAACHEATGGNPFLLAELFRALADEGPELGGGGPERIARLAAAGASTAILGRLARLGDDETEVARAVAILEPRAEVRLVARMSGRSAGEVGEAGERLVAASLFSEAPSLAFAHPLVREAVLTDMGERARRAANARAAQLLDEDGADLDTVAAHLLLSEPMGDAWVVERLREAGAAALERGAPESSIGYLRRALEEPPAPADRLTVRKEFGFALLRGDDGDGLDVMRGVLGELEDPGARAEVAAILSNSLMFRAQHPEAEAILHHELRDEPDPGDELNRNLHLHLLLATLGGFEGISDRYLAGVEDGISAGTIEGRGILSVTALLYALGAGPMEAVPRFVERIGLDADQEVGDARNGYPGTAHILALSLADRGDIAIGRFANVIAGAELRGTVTPIMGVYGSRAFSHFADGELSAGQADAEIALRTSHDAGFTTTAMSWTGAAIRGMTARGDLAGAEALTANLEKYRVPPGMPGALALIARGELRQASGRHAEACEDFRAAGDRLAWIKWPNPEGLGWRHLLAVSLAALGDRDEARRLAAEAAEHADLAGATRGIGVIRRIRGTIEGGDEGIDLLRMSVEALAGTRAKLQLAESLIELGAALRRANHRKEAREPLAEGLEIAHRCGAAPLEERARTELAAAGARPRSVVRTGVEALTPSELRVATLASQGLTNRQIAQSLTVTPKTVETHLRHVFQKLDLTKRTELAGSLDAS